MPKATAMTPTTKLAMVYRDKLRRSQFLSRVCFSKANAENVVKPPHKPVAKNKVVLKDNKFPLADRPKIRPISRQPTMLTTKVPRKKL